MNRCIAKSLSVVGFLCLSPLSLFAAPKIVCDHPEFDFGTVDDAPSVEHVYRIRNAGDSELQVTNVRASCGCTKAEIDSRTLAAGQATDLRVQLDLKGRSGKQRKSIYIHSNDPNQAQYQLLLLGDVRKVIEVMPERVYLSAMAGQKAEGTEVQIQTRLTNGFQVTAAEAPTNGYFDVRHESVENGRIHKVRILPRDTAALPPGTYNSTLILRTDLATRPVIDVPVVFSVRAAVSVLPQEIYTGRNPQGPLVRYLLVRSWDNRPLGKVEVECPGAEMDVLPADISAGQRRLQLTFRNPAELAGKSVIVRVEAQGLGERLLTVPVLAERVRSAGTRGGGVE